MCSVTYVTRELRYSAIKQASRTPETHRKVKSVDICGELRHPYCNWSYSNGSNEASATRSDPQPRLWRPWLVTAVISVSDSPPNCTVNVGILVPVLLPCAAVAEMYLCAVQISGSSAFSSQSRQRYFLFQYFPGGVMPVGHLVSPRV